MKIQFVSILVRLVKIRVGVVSIDNIVYRAVNVPLLRNIVQSQHGELTNLQYFFWLASIKDVLRVRGQIYVSMV